MKLTKIYVFFLLAVMGFFTSCEKEEDPVATVTFTPISVVELDGDVTGNGGSTSQTYTWENSLSTAEYNMDITSTKGGSLQLLMKDADGEIVLDNTLIAGQGDDSRSGVTASGTPGKWTLTATLSNFDGDGSFSISQGD